MMNDVFAGMPCEHIKNVILKRAITNRWDKLVYNLEHFNDSMIGNELPEVGSTIAVKYHVDLLAEDQGYMEPCIVLGYNASIPEYIKYKNGNERIYLKSWNGNVLDDVAPIASGTRDVYTKSYDETTFETTYTPIEKNVIVPADVEMFRYGNNDLESNGVKDSTYSVPKTIVIDGKIYAFAGYNITF